MSRSLDAGAVAGWIILGSLGGVSLLAVVGVVLSVRAFRRKKCN